MVEVTKDYLYRFKKNGNGYSIYLGNEPVTIWMDLKNATSFTFFVLDHPRGKNLSAFLQIYGRFDCQIIIGEDAFRSYFRLPKNPDCFTSCPRYQDKYTPVTMWTEGGPDSIWKMHSELDDKLYLPENEMKEFIAARPCKQTNWLVSTFPYAFPNSDYSHLKSDPNEMFKNENGINFVHLNNNGTDTVVWVEVKDSAPEHYVIIKTEDDNQSVEEDVRIGLEANGLEPVSFDLKKNFTEIPNGIKIYLKKVICYGDVNFLGHVRYIFNVNSTTNFTATFYDVNDTNLELKYLEEEKNGIPKPYSEPNQFEFFTISLVPVTTTTTSPVKNIPNDEIPSAAPLSQPENEIPSKAAEIPGFFLPVLVALFMAQKLFVLFY